MTQSESPDHREDLSGEPEDKAPDSPIELPPSASFPPPPEVRYTRPILKNDPAAPVMPGQMSRSEKYDSAAKMGGGLSAGITFAASVIVGLLIGQFIDHRFEPNGMPWGTIVGVLLGFAAGFMTFLRITSSVDRNVNRKK